VLDAVGMLQAMLQGAGLVSCCLRVLKAVLLTWRFVPRRFLFLGPRSWVLVPREAGRYATDTCLYSLTRVACRCFKGVSGRGLCSVFEDILF
jgi:hypothetical protein